MKNSIKTILKILTSLFVFFALLSSFAKEAPNVIIILADDQGYQDIGIFGAQGFKTPNLDNLATEGLVAKSFYVSSSVCTPSRAALQTGKWHFNVKLHSVGDKSKVYFPYSTKGMNQKEITIAEVLKTKNYKTALIGKWHLGHQDEYLPMAQGYDYFYGIPFSNDMWLPENMNYAKDILLREGVTKESIKKYESNQIPSFYKYKVPLMRQNEVIEFPAEQETLSKRYVDEAINFIKEAKEEAFYLCLCSSMPHNPVFASQDFKGKTKRGEYGDVMEELDFNVGRLIDFLKAENLFENTIIIYTSDNGPYLDKEKSYGRALPLKGGKFGLDEGGVRVPFIITYPKLIKESSQSYEIMSSIDILPTLAELCEAEAPKGIDGKSLVKFLAKETLSPRNEFIYSNAGLIKDLRGIRIGDWKLIKDNKGNNFALYNLKEDISEKENIIKKNPEKFQELKALLRKRSNFFLKSR